MHAEVGDRHGNLVFEKSARNFSPLAAMAGRVCIAQVERLVEPGEIDPDHVHLPGVFVHRVLEVGTDIDLPRLHAELPEVTWTRYADFVRPLPWPDLLKTR